MANCLILDHDKAMEPIPQIRRLPPFRVGFNNSIPGISNSR